MAQSIHGRGLAQEALARLVSSEQGGALALVGDAGIGKSRLAAWAGERGHKARRVVVRGGPQTSSTLAPTISSAPSPTVSCTSTCSARSPGRARARPRLIARKALADTLADALRLVG
ncbi:MAG TPA: hypothetical protein VHK23_04050 [Miltoncostaeaceae bacterium]|nr:hypothetical protein [Miltoncostaeaceae bacterium]